LDKIEWIIADDGTDPIENTLKKIKIPFKYNYIRHEKMTLGKKRNLLYSKCKGEYIINMDDDDYYPPERIEHAIRTLQSNRSFLIAGSSTMYTYFSNEKKVFICGPYGKNHCTAATMAFHRSLLDFAECDDKSHISEEKYFLNDYKTPVIQLDPRKTIVVLAHTQNTCDKSHLLKDPMGCGVTPTDLTINDLITSRRTRDKFLSATIEAETYEYGDLSHKGETKEAVDGIIAQSEAKKRKILTDMIIKHTEEGKISTESLRSFLENSSNTYTTSLLESKNALIDKLFNRIKILKEENERYRNTFNVIKQQEEENKKNKS
tara:strand:- start:1182 stop:2138 length:957 start_codon:yes stop_codon:yes gene_type:complete